MTLDPKTRPLLQAKLRSFYEERMSDGQSAFFSITDGRLVSTMMGRHWLAEHQRIFARALALEASDDFLDVGCGEGYYTMPLAQGARTSVGLDVSFSVLSLMQTLREYDATHLHLAATDVEQLPFADASFDKSLCSHTLEHVLDDRAVVCEIHRVVKPGGVSVFAVPLKYTIPYRLIRSVEGIARTIFRPGKKPAPVAPPGTLDVRLVGVQAHIRHYSVSAFCEMLTESGFAVRRVNGMWFHDPRNWFVYHTQPNRIFYTLATRLSKIVPDFGAGLVVESVRQ